MIVWGVDRFPPVAGCWVFRLGGHWIPVRQSVAKAQWRRECRPMVSGRRVVCTSKVHGPRPKSLSRGHGR